MIRAVSRVPTRHVSAAAVVPETAPGHNSAAILVGWMIKGRSSRGPGRVRLDALLWLRRSAESCETLARPYNGPGCPVGGSKVEWADDPAPFRPPRHRWRGPAWPSPIRPWHRGNPG